MCSVVIGQNFWMLKCRARTRISFSATRLDRHAICCTQLTVGLLLLKRVIRYSARGPQMCSIMSHSRTRPARSRSEFVIVPFGVASEITLAVMSGGHCNRNTIGGHSDSSPMMTPPTPWLEASTSRIKVHGNVLDDSWIPVGSFGSLILPHEGNCSGGSKPPADVFLGDGCTVRGGPGHLGGR